MKCRLANICVFIFALLAFIESRADMIYVPVKQLKDNWLVFDERYETYVPFVVSVHGRRDVLHMLVDPNLYQDQYLSFKAQNGLSVFFNNKIYSTYFNESTIQIPLELIKHVGGGKPVAVSFEGNYELLPIRSIAISVLKRESETVVSPNDDESMVTMAISRPDSAFASQYLLVVLIVLGSYIFQKYASFKTFQYIYNPLILIGKERFDDLSAHSDMDKFQLIYMVMNCLCLSLIIVTGFYSLEQLEDFNLLKEVGTLTFLLLAGYFIKYIFLVFCGFVFNVPKLVKIQFFEFLRLTLIFSLILFIITLIFFSPFSVMPEMSRLVFDYSVFVLLVFLIVKIGFTLKTAGHFQNVYLISYLCITEILPVLFFYRIYFNAGYILNL